MTLETHPCFTNDCSDYARIHLPVAPNCNLQCNYCLRKFDCANECRPGVSSKVLKPLEAFEYYKSIKGNFAKLTTVGIAGPGDALANFEEVYKTLSLIRAFDKEVYFCLSTNGLLLPDYINALKAVGVGYITVTVNTLNAKTALQIYDCMYLDKQKWQGQEAMSFLLAQQQKGVRKAKALGIKVKINTVAIPSVNTDEITDIAEWAAGLSCDVMNIIPMLPVAGTKFAKLPALKQSVLQDLRKSSSLYIRQMLHCNHCRADAVGCLKKEKGFEKT